MRPESQSSGLLMRAAQNAAKRILRQAVRVLRGHEVFTLTGAMRSSLGRYEVPDPGTMSASPSDGARARDAWNRAFPAAPAFWIGVIGGIGPRKNLDVVAEAVSALTGNIGLVIAGQAEVDESIIERWLTPATEHGVPIMRLAGTLGEHDFDSIIQGLDCVVVAHSNEGPSGILAKAVMAHTAVVAAGAQSLKRDAEFSGGRVLWSELTPEGIASSLTSVLHSAPPEAGPTLDSQQIFADRLLSGARRRFSWSEKTVGLSGL
ncbi:glycosyltransferase [Microbacterium testaceum]|uniref:glycosyltransferase n=1 Tax=Microbacterium testaceum TaxID=2033 RepID=UPI00128F5FF5|nr:glycosyltransferase [Microbacterium testaceum]